MAACWRYLKDFSTAEDNFLPPDNFQEQPPTGAAHRTSPTNIGLALAAAAVSAECGIIPRKGSGGLYLPRRGGAEKMPRCMGHYYNWYDTRTLAPLSPPYISTVDSGNMYAGLLCAANALDSWGNAELSSRLRAIMAGMDFAPLYDRVRGLFYICYDTVNNAGSGGWYDPWRAEAVLTSCHRRRERGCRAALAPPEPRAAPEDGYRGLASWTGTMFEDPCRRCFCRSTGQACFREQPLRLYVQKRRRLAASPGAYPKARSTRSMPPCATAIRRMAADLALKRGQGERHGHLPIQQLSRPCGRPCRRGAQSAPPARYR